MALMDVIDSLYSDHDLVVTRRTGGAMVNGIWVPGTASTFLLPSASVQPATGMQRVVGGRDMLHDEQGQRTVDVRVIYTYVELKCREPGIDPDQIAFEGGAWVVVRAERWVLNTEVIFRSLMTRETRGAS